MTNQTVKNHIIAVNDIVLRGIVFLFLSLAVLGALAAADRHYKQQSIIERV